MKRSPMPQRTVPLQSGDPLTRVSGRGGTPAVAKQHNQPKPAKRSYIPPRIRKALKERSEGLCEIGQPGCTRVATEAAHRLKVGMGGRKGAAAEAHHVLSNLMHSCHECHQVRCHRFPKDAETCGWILREGSHPLSEPVLYRGAWRLLDDAGQVLPYSPTA